MKKIGFILFLLFGWSVYGQQIDSLSKPKVGLVLSGGGAKGLAHIGVLKALEKYRIHPDYIGGTSMGAIVGSMYAAGYSAAQIDSIFHLIDFDKILYNRLSRKYLNNFKKERGKRFIINFPVSLQSMSVQLPRGLSDSQQMFNVLAEVLLPAHQVEDFSNLKIPYICMSTDIVTGNQVLFNRGYLPAAVTASALLPSVYKPVDDGSKLLLDGGIVNNYPVQEVKDLGADFMIGSDVQGKILSKNDIKDMASILDQIVSFGMYKEMPLKKTMTDLYIHPDITGFGVTSFENIDTIIARGERSTLQKLKQLPYIERLQSDKPVKKLRYHAPDSLVFDRIVLSGQKNFTRDYILGKIGVRTHEKISYHDFLDGINNLIGSDNFEKVYYRFKVERGLHYLYLDLKERLHKASMSLGFHFNDLYKINVIANFENKRIFTNNDMLSVDVIGGNYFRYNFDYIIDNGFKLSWGFHSGLQRFAHRVNADDLFGEQHYSVNKLDFNYFQFSNKLYFQGNLNHFLYLKMGVQHQYKKLYTYVFSSAQDDAYYFGRDHNFGNFVSINFDSRDDYDFPTKGLYLKAKWDYVWSSSDFYDNFKPYSLYVFKVNWMQRLNKFLLLQPQIVSGLHYGKSYNYENIFYLGGLNAYTDNDQIVNFKPLPVLSVNATKFAVFSLSPVLQLHKNHFIEFGGHLLFYDKSNDLLPEHSKSLYGFNFGYGFKSFLGPLRINFGRIPQWQKNTLNISLGYNF